MATNIVKTKKDISNITNELTLELIISKVIEIPGVRVDRNKFLAEQLVNETDDIQLVLDKGPIAAGIEEKKLARIAEKLIIYRTSEASLKSFALGIPGGLAATIAAPTDILQFYGMTLKIAQELTYLYGSKDLWVDGKVDEELVRNNLILYFGAMFGISYAVAGVKVITTQIAKTVVKQLPKKTLTKTFWYPIVQKIGKSLGVKITKTVTANGISKVVPYVGGIISGALTFASMKPMADRLLGALIEANFDYDDVKLNKDIDIIGAVNETDILEEENSKSLLVKGKEKINNLFKKKEKVIKIDSYEELRKLKKLLDEGIITQEEFDNKKKKILNL